MTALIRASSLNGYRELVCDLGGDPDYFLRRLNISPDLLHDEAGTYPLRSFVGLLETTASEMRCPDFGLRLSEMHGSRHLGAVGVIGLNSATVGDAINDILNHLDFHCPAVICRLDTRFCPGKTTLTWDFSLTEVHARTQIDESAVGNIHQELSILTQNTFAPVMVLFRHSATKPLAAYRQYFRAPIYFEQEVNGVVFDTSVLDRKLNQANPLLHKLAVAYVRETAERFKLDIAAQVGFLVRRLLPTMRCGLGDVSQQLCIHERTLQRKLKSANVVFEDIVDDVRKARAEELLTQSSLSMAQIAESLGYAEQASFNRACLRWFQATPSAIRRSAQRESGDGTPSLA